PGQGNWPTATATTSSLPPPSWRRRKRARSSSRSSARQIGDQHPQLLLHPIEGAGAALCLGQDDGALDGADHKGRKGFRAVGRDAVVGVGGGEGGFPGGEGGAGGVAGAGWAAAFQGAGGDRAAGFEVGGEELLAGAVDDGADRRLGA